MCRFLCYRGPEILLCDLLYRPTNSLIRQSFHAKERTEPLNGDGFGVGWYAPQISSTPCVFASVTPAWSNQNLRQISEHVKSGCFFAHVRAASPGMRVSEANCHPFQYGRFLWMHNGVIRDFWHIKRRLRASLPDQFYNMIEGTTDSEHAFAVFLHLLGDPDHPHSTREIGEALVQTIDQLERWTAETGRSGPSYYNFAVADGQSVAAVRYVSDPLMEPQSLYYSTGGKYECRGGICKLCECHPSERTVIIASERLTSDAKDWVRVAPNHLLTVAPDLTVNVKLIDVARIGLEVIGQSSLMSERVAIP
ncbi:MAG TPA: class II glutamine amidotransferase [Candidatus Udaeobacter sp.]|nr:class II glutamine amidotransferase [Candidatus Udaeobacter sp.]